VAAGLAAGPRVGASPDPGYRKNFNRIVFASHWQQQQYNLFLGIPYSEGVVIKNGVPRLSPTLPKEPVNDKLRFLYTSTPHRGLNVLAAAADALAQERQDWELHVYSSLNIYGWHEQDKQMQPLYDKLQANPCVVYHGSRPERRGSSGVLDAHIFVYPSIYQETSCMAIQEAMMAGCLTITSNLGALIETCGEWA
jgi:UDP-glucose:(glucosyl)LPS alpha-1,2-glucosyltransferase